MKANKSFTKKERSELRKIASFYGCGVKFTNGHLGGTWHGNYIEIGSEFHSFSSGLSTFFHELAHFVNWKTKKYPVYHNPKNFNKMNLLIPQYGRRIRYSLMAEVYTEKVAARLLKEWFPSIKYLGYYKDTKVCYEFLFGYYLNYYLR